MARWNTAFHTVEVCYSAPDRISLLLSLQRAVASICLYQSASVPEFAFEPISLQMRMKKLEEIRLEVDSRRRTVQELTQKVRFMPIM